MTEKRYLDWEIRVHHLDLAEIKFLDLSEQGRFSKKEKKKIRSVLDDLWIRVWDYYPDKNHSIEEAFKLNFG